MKILAALSLTSSELTVVMLGCLVLVCYGLRLFVHWLVDGPKLPEPWSDQVEADLARNEGTPLCCRCLEPHDDSTDFCPHCGAPVGTYTNLLPYPYLFSLGDLLRVGTSGAFHRTPVTVIGFFLLGLAEYTIFAPYYWYHLFLRNLNRQQPEARPAGTLPQTPA